VAHVGCKQANKNHVAPHEVTIFLKIFLEYSWKNLQKDLFKSFKTSLYYFVKVCVENFPKICHFQNFPSPFTSFFLLLTSGGYKSFYTTFEGPNVNNFIFWTL